MLCCGILTVLKVVLQDASFCEISDRCLGEPLILTMLVKVHEWLSKQFLCIRRGFTIYNFILAKSLLQRLLASHRNVLTSGFYQ